MDGAIDRKNTSGFDDAYTGDLSRVRKKQKQPAAEAAPPVAAA